MSDLTSKIHELHATLEKLRKESEDQVPIALLVALLVELTVELTLALLLDLRKF